MRVGYGEVGGHEEAAERRNGPMCLSGVLTYRRSLMDTGTSRLTATSCSVLRFSQKRLRCLIGGPARVLRTTVGLRSFDLALDLPRRDRLSLRSAADPRREVKSALLLGGGCELIRNIEK